jgi:hypothetical protein
MDRMLLFPMVEMAQDFQLVLEEMEHRETFGEVGAVEVQEVVRVVE